jgi:hypothetical protein
LTNLVSTSLEQDGGLNLFDTASSDQEGDSEQSQEEGS